MSINIFNMYKLLWYRTFFIMSIQVNEFSTATRTFIFWFLFRFRVRMQSFSCLRIIF